PVWKLLKKMHAVYQTQRTGSDDRARDRFCRADDGSGAPGPDPHGGGGCDRHAQQPDVRRVRGIGSLLRRSPARRDAGDGVRIEPRLRERAETGALSPLVQSRESAGSAEARSESRCPNNWRITSSTGSSWTLMSTTAHSA